MQLSPTTVATVILESNNPQVLLNCLAELKGLNAARLPDSYIAKIIYAELGKELAQLQRKQDQLQSLLDNAGPNADLGAKNTVSDELRAVQQRKHFTLDIQAIWEERFPRCIPAPRLTLARAKALLAVQPK